MDSNGVDVSTIDYILYGSNMANMVTSLLRIEDAHANVSDHYPVQCQLKYHIDPAEIKE